MARTVIKKAPDNSKANALLAMVEVMLPSALDDPIKRQRIANWAEAISTKEPVHAIEARFQDNETIFIKIVCRQDDQRSTYCIRATGRHSLPP